MRPPARCRAQRLPPPALPLLRRPVPQPRLARGCRPTTSRTSPSRSRRHDRHRHGRPVHHDRGYIPDLLAASAALPALFPPVTLKGPDGPATHVDAGSPRTSRSPAPWALAQPGDRIWVLDVTRVPQTPRTLRNPLDVLIASLAASVRNREEPAFAPGVEIMRCKLDETYDCGPVFDFSHTAELFRLGEEAAVAALNARLASVDSLVA